MIMSSLFSGRIIFDVSDDLNLLNDDNGASPMFNLQNNPFRVNKIDKSIDNSNISETTKSFGSVLTQSGANRLNGHDKTRQVHFERESNSPTNLQRTYGSTGKHSLNINSISNSISPVSRINSENYASGFKRPLFFPSTKTKNTSSKKEILYPSKSASMTNNLSKQPYQELNLNQSSAKRLRKDSEGTPPLLKSHSMSALCQMPLLDLGEIKQVSNKNYLCRPKKEFQHNSRLCRSKSFMDPAAAARVMDACKLAESDSNRTGDTRLKLLLPSIQGHSKNSDLKNIDCHTLANLLNGQYKENISRCRIIDARYCYEYEGGHIRGAENFGMWEEEAFLAEFFPPSLEEKPLTPKPLRSTENENKENENIAEKDTEKREIIIFHCEFSSARGPALMRLLRKKDREINKATYPALHYPECYLLHDGYKAFYEAYPQLCVGSYLPMKHPQFAHEERKFHKKSKSWAAGGGGTISRTGASSRLLKL